MCSADGIAKGTICAPAPVFAPLLHLIVEIPLGAPIAVVQFQEFADLNGACECLRTCARVLLGHSRSCEKPYLRNCPDLLFAQPALLLVWLQHGKQRRSLQQHRTKELASTCAALKVPGCKGRRCAASITTPHSAHTSSNSFIRCTRASRKHRAEASLKSARHMEKDIV